MGPPQEPIMRRRRSRSPPHLEREEIGNSAPRSRDALEIECAHALCAIIDVGRRRQVVSVRRDAADPPWSQRTTAVCALLAIESCLAARRRGGGALATPEAATGIGRLRC